MHTKMLVYLMFFIYDISAGMTEFPCKYPCPWRNKTFVVYRDGEVFQNWTFNSDGQTSIFGTTRYPCHQITERFLIMREADSQFFKCVSIFYDITSPLKFQFQDKGDKFLKNQIGEITDLCGSCGTAFSILEAVVSGSPSTSPAVNSLPCDIPSTCTPPPGIPCHMNDTIPKGCQIATTESPTTTTEPTTITPEPTTTTPEPTFTTTEPTTTTKPTTTTPEQTTTTTETTAHTTESTTATTEPTKTTKWDCRKKDHKHTK